jgi:hypothetical protein
LQGVSLLANEEKDVPIISAKKIIVSKMASMGTSAGECQIGLGERGDFFDLAPGDEIEVSQCSHLRFRNLVAAPRSFQLLISNDRNFSLKNYNRGL